MFFIFIYFIDLSLMNVSLNRNFYWHQPVGLRNKSLITLFYGQNLFKSLLFDLLIILIKLKRQGK